MKIKFFKIKKRFKKGGLHASPDLYWNILQGIALAIIFGSFVFGFFLFRKINEEFTLSISNSSEQTEIISEEKIDKILKYFSDREEKSNQIINSPSPIADPSL